MYDNIGGKIKGLAMVICLLFGLTSVIVGIALISDDDLVAIGIATMLLGPVLSWLFSCLIYGFGELIEKVTDIVSDMQAKATSERLEKIYKLRSQGLITEEEFRNAITR